MRYTALVGRLLFSVLFVVAGLGNFSGPVIAFAASQGVPLASLLVPFSGILAIVGGLSIALGYKTELGAVLIILFLVPVTFKMHAFWTVHDPMAAQDQLTHFMKNVSMIGTALLISYFGPGPVSLDGHEYVRTLKAPTGVPTTARARTN
jgi:putative oxidoreductase